MPRKPVRLAKLTRPRLHKVLARHRLFAQLDAGRERAVVWVVGPPGSGKTALVASYVDATRVHCVWYHVDGGDHEPATFFHYLSQCIDTTARQAPLPRITPEYLADLPAFTRYYFREFFARLKSPAVLVFGNYQDIPAQSAMHAVLEQAATTMAIVMEEGARRKGVAPPAEAIAQMRARVIEAFEQQQSAFYTSGLMLDDGVIDPRDTRRVVALALSVCADAERRTLRPLIFGVARM